MSFEWYYVSGSDSIGPVEQTELEELVGSAELNESSYVWREGMENWLPMKDVPELASLFASELVEEESDEEYEEEYEEEVENDDTQESYVLPDLDGGMTFDWQKVKSDVRIFSIKTGYDRKISEQKEYGPFSLSMLKKLFEEKRINARTLIFSPGMENWQFLADIPIYQKLFNDEPPRIDDSERRISERKPFVARILFVDKNEVFEGICRDISIGGLQMIVAECPVDLGEEVTMNVHPDNSDYSFTAKGEVVRILDGRHGFSVKFKGLDEQAKEAIGSYLSGE